jgi:hypothetical protein
MPRKRRVDPPEPEPRPAPFVHRRPDSTQSVSIVVRPLVPLVARWVFRGSVENFLLLSVFDIALGIACLAVVGVAVSTRQELGDRGAADSIGALVALVAVGAAVTLVLTALFGWVIALIASESALGLWNAPLGWAALAIVLTAIPGVTGQYRADLAAKLPEAVRKRRDQPMVGGQLLGAGLVFLVSGYAAQGGQVGITLLAIAITGLFIFRDLRPDVVARLVPPPK